MNTSKKNPAAGLPTDERVRLAKERMKRVVDHTLHCLALEETNAIVVYSDLLASQIGVSHAGHAFQLLQDSLFRFSVIRLYALWDQDDTLECESIPTVVQLVDHPSVVNALAEEMRIHWMALPHIIGGSTDPELSAIELECVKANQVAFADRMALKMKRGLRRAISSAQTVISSDELEVIKHLRTKHLAHAVSKTRAEKKYGPIRSMKYGEEKALFKKTIPIVRGLYSWVNGTSFSFNDSRRIDRKQAEALWHGCTFKPLR